tara:strand:- start:12588 stop:15365 length:2778 start_codon:yes stop_codon:yes gene_type:complete
MAAPELSPHDVQEETRRWFRARRDHPLVAFYGVGSEDRVPVDKIGVDVAVIPADSELRLRERLLELNEGDCAVFLLAWDGTLPMDIAGRFAKSGRIQRIGRESRIKNLFRASDIDPEVRDSPLAAYLLDHHTDTSFSTEGGRLTIDVLWRSWLERVWGLPSGELALDSLLGFVAVDARGPQLVATLDEHEASGVREALRAHLDDRLGICGPVVWNAWEAGKGRELMHLAMYAAGIDDSGQARAWLDHRADALIDAGDATTAILKRLGDECGAVVRFIERRSGAADVRALAREADAQIKRTEQRLSLLGSDVLPLAWQGRLDALGRCLKEHVLDPSQELFEQAVARFRALSTHSFYKESEHKLVIHRAEMAVRLAGWLHRHQEVQTPPSSYGDVEELSNWFVTEGGYVDWARKTARGTREGEFNQGVFAILERVDAIRQVYDRRFANALPFWIDAKRVEKNVLPIDHAVKRIASRFLAENDERKLLVLLMDGMAWAQAAEILDGLGREAAVWGPLGWHGLSKHKIGTAYYPPMITNFPSVTEVSRSAFFAGKCMKSGKNNSSSNDPKVWKENSEVLKYYEAGDEPKLLLRGEGQTKDGSASTEALSLVADTKRRLVGVVINTIDMSLKNDVAQRQEWRVDNIKAMRDLLDKCREVGRSVLLVADHGHVPVDRMTNHGSSDGGHRYRPWKKGEAVAEYEVALPAGPGVWAPRGADGVVLLADDGHRYGGGTSSGEHGGAALAEAVAPCVLIGCEDTPGVDEDSALSVRPAPVPSWWHFDVGRVLGAKASEAAPSGRKGKGKKPVKSQLSLPQMGAPKVEEAEVAVAGDEAGLSAFAQCEMLKLKTKKKSERDEVAKVVDFLLARNGIAEAAAFANAMAMSERRVRGLVSKLQEVLNVDGYQVIRYEAQSRQVRLDREVLAQQFEVEL